jgi:hypothetical protein
MPFGVEVPWWVYGIIVIIVVIILYALYEKLTAYTPAQTAFNQNETALPSNFDAAGQAKNADDVLDEIFGTDDQSLIDTLSGMTDNELIATSNAYTDKYYTDANKTLYQRLVDMSTDTWFTSTGAKRDTLVAHMKAIGLT